MQFFNGVAFFDKPHIQFEVHLDASLTGFGAICGKEIYHTDIPDNLKHSDIAILEMFNILLALRVWSNQWSGKLVSIQCDNQAVVEILNNGKTRNMQLAAVSRNIFMTCAKFDIELKVSHILGRNNPIADLPSRWSQLADPDGKLSKLMNHHVEMPIEKSMFDLDYTI